MTLLPGGVNSPVRAFKSVGGQPIIFDHVSGPYCFDVDGNKVRHGCVLVASPKVCAREAWRPVHGCDRPGSSALWWSVFARVRLGSACCCART